MTRKKSSNSKNQTAKTQKSPLQSETNREAIILNAMANTSIILMSTMMGAFTQVMTTATGAMSSGMAAAMGGKEAEEKVSEEFKQELPKVDKKVKVMISDIRKDVYAQMKQKREQMQSLLSDPKFDVGPKIIEKYDFKLPRLNQELDDDALAQYLQLFTNQDPTFSKMFAKLIEWINSLPKPSERNKKR
jgi:uncharacterized membrane protein